jgi:hypothetical protein
MQVLSPGEALETFACPACRWPDLEAEDDAVVCPACDRRYALRDGVVDFVLRDVLSETARRELEANAVDLASTKAVRKAVEKGERDWGKTERMRRTAVALSRYLDDYDNDTALVSLGSGAGYELKHLLAGRDFRRVYSSDIAWTRSALVPRTLEGERGELVVFAADFDHSPVKRRDRQLGLVFQALHHSDDAHRSLAVILERSFDDVIVVEPVTNWLVELLARLGQAKRVEYSGVQPDWMRLPRIRELARERGLDVRIITWWELPLERLPKRLRRSRRALRVLFAVTAAASRVLGVVRLGSMAAVHLSRSRQ